MKKVIISLLLIALALSTTACTCGDCTACTGSCTSCSTCPDPTFNVNQQQCIGVPSTISPPSCIIPQVECPQVCPPPVEPPKICKPEIDIPEVTPPPVVQPPTICPPEVIIPDILPPCAENPIAPPPPPMIPSVCDPVIAPTGPMIPIPPPPTFVDDKLTRKFKLQFEYGCKTNLNLRACKGNVLWNDVIIYSINPVDYDIHTLTLYVYVNAGENKLQFEGIGHNNFQGLGIDNVILVRDGTISNIVVNGDFEVPDAGNSWIISNNILGWEGQAIEVIKGSLKNAGWNSQICELSSNRNFQITQKWSFDSDYKLVSQIACNVNSFNGQTLQFKLEFDWAARAY